MSGPAAPDDDPLVEFILAQDGLLDALLADHRDDGGGRCRACPGPQSGRRRWPCDIHRAAERAAEVRARGQAGP